MEKVESMHERMGDIRLEMKLARRTQKEMLKIKNSVTERMPLMNLLADRTQLRKELLNLRISN